MSKIILGREIGARLCEVFGLESSAVSKIRFEFNADDIAKVYIEMAVRDDQVDEIVVIMKSYALEEITK